MTLSSSSYDPLSLVNVRIVPWPGVLIVSSHHGKICCITSIVSLRLEGCCKAALNRPVQSMWCIKVRSTERNENRVIPSKQGLSPGSWMYIHDFLITIIYRQAINIKSFTRYCQQFLILEMSIETSSFYLLLALKTLV